MLQAWKIKPTLWKARETCSVARGSRVHESCKQDHFGKSCRYFQVHELQFCLRNKIMKPCAWVTHSHGLITQSLTILMNFLSVHRHAMYRSCLCCKADLEIHKPITSFLRVPVCPGYRLPERISVEEQKEKLEKGGHSNITPCFHWNYSLYDPSFWSSILNNV